MPLTPPYSLLTRTAKGSQLTIDELDGNLLWLSTTMSGSINSITGSLGISGSNIEVVTSLFNLFSETLITGSVTINPNSIPNPISGSYTLDGSLIFNGDLTISSGSELIIPSGVALTLNGALINNGDLVNSGSYINLAPTSPYMTLSVLGNVSASGYYGDGSGLTGVTATTTLPAGLVSSSLQFTSTDDVTFRNITASGNISASGLFSATSGSFDLIQLDNNGKIQLGSGNDLEIFHNGSDAYIRNNGNGNLYIEDRDYGGDIYMRPQPGHEGIIIYNGSGVNLYHANSLKASTVANGFQVTGNITASGDISASGNITATSFIGDGSSLTNLQRPTSLSVSANMTASNDNAGYFFEVGAVTCSIQSSSLVACDIGSEFEFFQSSSGNFIFVTGSGVTLMSKGGALTLTGQYSAATLKKIRDDEWILVGDLT
jgi:hypothetical protein